LSRNRDAVLDEAARSSGDHSLPRHAIVAPDQFDRGTLGRDRPDCCALFTWRYQFARCPRKLDRAGSVAAAVLTTAKMPTRMAVLPMPARTPCISENAGRPH